MMCVNDFNDAIKKTESFVIIGFEILTVYYKSSWNSGLGKIIENPIIILILTVYYKSSWNSGLGKIIENPIIILIIKDYKR